MMHCLTFSSAKGAAKIIDQATPVAYDQDILVSISAVAVNPVDLKIQSTITDHPKTLGWDACAKVVSVGPQVRGFKPGDRVFYAGDVSRPGCFASHQLVDSRIVAHAPHSIDDVQAASLPLTSLTAWELLFNRLRISLQKDAGKTLLIIGGAGGVGSMLIQLAKQLAGLRVIASASNASSSQWCQELGADHVVSHSGNLLENYQQSDLPAADYIICLADSDRYYPMMAELIAPQGLIGLVVNFAKPVDLNLLKNKSAGLVWEFMFTRPLLNTADMQQQQLTLQRIAELVDIGCLQPVLSQQFDVLNSETLAQAHQQLTNGGIHGKIGLGALEMGSKT